MEIPTQFKPLTAYIRRAEELDREVGNPNAPVVAYFCRFYAINKGMTMGVPQNEMGFLAKLMDVLEQSKKKNPDIEKNGKAVCQDFALQVFSTADDEDRNTGSTMSTAKVFYAAAAFFDILEQFGDLEPDVLEKRRYSKWKAAEIAKAIKEGRKPAQGSGDNDTNSASNSVDFNMGLPSAPVNNPADSPAPVCEVYDPAGIPAPPTFVPPPSVPMPGYTSPAPVAHQPKEAPRPQQQSQHQPQQHLHVPSAKPAFNSSVPPKSMNDPRAKDCVELCQFAIAALKYNDINLARSRLAEALRMLD